jgi:hypothetical protein
MDFQQIVNRLGAMPAVVNLLDVNYACFWTSLSAVYGVAPDTLAAVFLASLWSDDILQHNHIGLVSPQQMTLAARFFHVGLNVHQGGGGAAVPADLFMTVAPVEGFPTLNLSINVTQTQIPGVPGGPNVALFHVANINPAAAGANPPFVPVPVGAVRPAAQPTLIGFTAQRLLPAFFMYSLCSFPVAFGDNYAALLNPGTANECSADYHNRRGGGVPLAAHPFVPLPRVGLSASEFQYTTSRPVAKALASDLRANRNVWLTGDSDASLPSQLLGCVKYADDRTVRLTTFLGVPGSGKTTAARGYFAANQISPHDVSWIFPSALVASDSLSSGVGPLGAGVLSSQYSEGFEIFRKPALRVLVIDDFTRFPPGTLDVLLYFNPSIEHVILTGDPAQSHTAFPTPNTETRSYESFGSMVVRQFPTASYATVSYRLAPRVADVLGLHSDAVHEGDILVTSQPPEGLPLFVTSPRFAETKTAGGTPTFVTSQSQGLDLAGDYCLDLGGMSCTMQNGPVLVGLTRGQGNVFLSIDAAALAPKVGSFSCSSILSSIAAVSARSRVSLIDTQTDVHRLIARSVTEHIRASVPSMRVQAAPIPLIGAADGLPSLQGVPVSTEAVLRGLSFMADAVPRVHRVGDATSVVRDVPVPTTVADPILEFAQPDAPDGLSAELRHSGAISVQKPSFKHPGANLHRRADHATMQASLAKRIHVASPERNQRSFFTVSTSSRFVSLKSGFLRVFPRFSARRDFSALVDQCGDEVFDSWTSKRTLKAIQRKISREAIGWDVGFTRLFLKSQVVKKTEKWFKGAGPGQIVAEFAMQKTFRDAVFALALEKVVLAECPENVYLHLRRSTSDLESWCGRNMAGYDDFVETDYSAWDSSIDAPFIKFDCWLMQQVGFPPSYISTYHQEACCTMSMKGNLRLMQHSGNRYTFLLNTLRNLALTQHTYQNIAHIPQAYGGDDSLLAGNPLVNPAFRPGRWLMSPKTIRTRMGHLFGHLVDNGSLSYDYEYMNNRLEVGIVGRPTDIDYFRSFADQMAALPRPDDPYYALVHKRLVEHCTLRSLVIPGLSMIPSLEPLFYPNSVFSNGIMPERFPHMWCD